MVETDVLMSSKPNNVPIFLLKISQKDKITINDSIESNPLIIPKIIEPYLKMIFNSLVKQSNIINGVSKNAFKNYTKLPYIISERLYMLLTKDMSTILTWEIFLQGLLHIFIGTLEEKINFIFNFYDADNDGLIKGSDVRLLLIHCPIESINLKCDSQSESKNYLGQSNNDIYLDRVQTYEEVNKLIITCFENDSQVMDKPHFLKLIMDFASDLFLPIYFLFRSRFLVSKKVSYLLSKQSYMLTSKVSTSEISTSKFLLKNKFTQSFVHYSPKISFSNQTIFFNKKTSNNLEEMKKESKKSLFDISIGKFTSNLEKPLNVVPKLSLDNIGKDIYTNCNEEIKNSSNQGSSVTNVQTPQFKFFENSQFKELTICGDCFSTDEHNNNICNKCSVLNSLKPISKYIYTLNSNLTMERVFIEVVSNEIFFYENELKTECLKILILSSVIISPKRIFVYDNQTEFYPIEFKYNLNVEKIFLLSLEDRNELLEAVSKEVNLKKFASFYQVKELIGRGRYSIVFRVFHKENQKEYAAKFISKKNLDLQFIEMIRDEIEILKILRHPNIINMVESFEEETCFYIVSEFLNGGELNLYWEKNDRKIPEALMKPVIHSLATSLYFMKHLGIIHRDLKPANIILNVLFPLSDVKIVDFGLSKIFFPNCKCNESFGTLAFVAPEVLSEKNYDYSIDVWSLGVILFYMISGQLPFDDPKDENISLKIVYDPPNLSSNFDNTQLSNEVIDLIKRMLDKNPNTRITLEEILTSNWVLNGNEELKTLRLTAPSTQKFRVYSITDPDNVNSLIEGLL